MLKLLSASMNSNFYFFSAATYLCHSLLCRLFGFKQTGERLLLRVFFLLSFFSFNSAEFVVSASAFAFTERQAKSYSLSHCHKLSFNHLFTCSFSHFILAFFPLSFFHLYHSVWIITLQLVHKLC